MRAPNFRRLPLTDAKTAFPHLTASFDPDFGALLRNLRREGTPERVHFMELGADVEIEEAADALLGLTEGLDRDDPDYLLKRHIAIRRGLGYDYVKGRVAGLGLQLKHKVAPDTAELTHEAGRSWMEEHRGPIASWEDFEEYPWPDPKNADVSELERLCELLPDGMGMSGHCGHFCENLCWLFGYENLCYQFYDNRDLVQAVADRILQLEFAHSDALLSLERCGIIWHSDDMGFKTGLMFSAEDMRHFVLSGHRKLADREHAAGRVVLLHACGKRDDIMEDLIEDAKFDGIHSFEDVIEPITDAKRRWGARIAVIGGVDVDYLARRSQEDIRGRVREILDVCQPGGGFALGSGNTVANYIPVANYLAMLDEGRARFQGSG